jgi:hypothetical protein
MRELIGKVRWGAALVCVGLLSSLAMPARSQEQCSVYSTYSDEVREVLTDGFEFPEYNEFCAWLNTNGLGVDVVAAGSIMEDRVVGWATVRLIRRSDNLVARSYSTSTAVGRTENQANPRGAMLAAINDAMSSIARQRDQHLADFRTFQTQIRER